MATALGIILYTGILLFATGEFEPDPKSIDNSVKLECNYAEPTDKTKLP